MWQINTGPVLLLGKRQFRKPLEAIEVVHVQSPFGIMIRFNYFQSNAQLDLPTGFQEVTLHLIQGSQCHQGPTGRLALDCTCYCKQHIHHFI